MREDEYEMDMLENLTQFVQVLAVTAAVGTGLLLKSIRERLDG